MTFDDIKQITLLVIGLALIYILEKLIERKNK